MAATLADPADSSSELSAGQRAGLLDSSTVFFFQFRNVAQIENYGVNASYEGSLLDGRLSYGANLTAAYVLSAQTEPEGVLPRATTSPPGAGARFTLLLP